MPIDVRETLLTELEALVEARARRRVVRERNQSTVMPTEAFKRAVEIEANELATVLYMMMDDRERRK